MELRCVVLLVSVVVVSYVDADVYFHNPPGSNNRLNGNKRNRQNNNRLFDSQNNQRGGYNVGGDGRKEDEGSLTYIGGSRLQLQWTNQHECGGKNTGCDIIIQYMCSDNLRDGITTSKPSQSRDRTRTGLHEDQAYYASCKGRMRDYNLYHADQKLRRKDARSTRQNRKGNRSGLECPEERDYYPYHAPTPWKDIAILTNNVARCDRYKSQSQNVIPKGYCNGARGLQPIRKAPCERAGGTWKEAPAHGIPAPECLPAPRTRDNHLGNTEPTGESNSEDMIPKTLAYNWDVPDVNEVGCVLRIRYNISIGDYDPFAVDSNNDNQNNKGKRDLLAKEYKLSGGEAIKRGYYIKNNPRIKPMKDVPRLDFRLALNTAQTGRTFEDRTHKFRITKRSNVKDLKTDAPVYNLNVIGKRGNIVQVYPAVEYGFEPAILKVNRGDYVMPQWTGSLRNPRNNDGEGARGEDKSNIITMTPRQYKENQAPKETLGHPGNSYPLGINKATFLGVDEAVALQLAFPKKSGNVVLRVGEKATFASIGCYRDRSNRAISGTMTVYSPNTAIQKCADRALRHGNQVFAVQFNKYCFTSATAHQTYMKYGGSRGCSRSGRGGRWRNHVYRVTSLTETGIEKSPLPPAACIPTRGPKAGQKCVFPFKYGRYTCAGPKCCNPDNDAGGSWCSTKVDESGNHIRGNWAYCKGTACDSTSRKDAQAEHVSDASPMYNITSFYAKTLDDIGEKIAKTEEKIEEILEKVRDGALEYKDDHFEQLLHDAQYANDTMTGATHDGVNDVLGERVKRGGGRNAAELDYSPATVSVGVIQANTCGTFNYLCTRNNNFSNRSQKGKVVVCS